jgi:hypothetical protein
VKTRCNLAESSKEGYGSKRAVLPMVMVMMIMNGKQDLFEGIILAFAWKD